MKKLIEIEMIPASNISMGWYDTYGDPIPRATSVRGIIRWWFRALVGGVTYDYGINETAKTQELQEELFGSTDKPSRIIFRIKKWSYDKFINSKTKEVPRVKMILLAINTLINSCRRKNFRRIPRQLGKVKTSLKGRMKEIYEERYNNRISEMLRNRLNNRNINEFLQLIEALRDDMLNLLFKNYRITLEVFSTEISNEISIYDKIGILSTIIGIELGSFGKISRRGYGSFIIKYENVRSKIHYVEDLIEECMRKNLTTRIKYLITTIREEISTKIKIENKRKVERLPSFPVVSSSSINETPIYSLWFGENKNIKEVQNMFVRTNRGSLADYLRQKGKASWYLGLPRSQRGTGYLSLSGEETRRPSPLWIKALDNNNILISHFISRDWPSAILWIGRYKKRINITEDLLLSVATEVNNYLEKHVYSRIY